MRVLIYSYDACGLGHLRRNFSLGQEIARRFPTSNVLSIVSSAQGIQCFESCSDRHDFIKLPGVRKVEADNYIAHPLQVPDGDLFELRRELLDRTIQLFSPALIVVDKNPRGLRNEMAVSLRSFLGSPNSPQIVLSLRDILDDPDAVHREWNQYGMSQWVEEIYDSIWIWGEEEVFDSLTAYRFSDALRGRSRYMGYLPPSEPIERPEMLRKRLGVGESEKLLLVSGGGGGDAGPLYHEVLHALAGFELSQIRILMVTGPLLSEQEFSQLKNRVEEFGERVHLFRHVRHFEDWIRASDAVISMGGYNTLREVASLGKPNLVVPRVYPRVEQLMRAKKFEGMGWCEIAMPGDSTAERIGEFCRRLVSGELNSIEKRLECRGFDSLVEEISALEKVRRPKVAHAG